MTLSEAYAILYLKYFIREANLEKDLRAHFKKKGYDFNLTSQSKHFLLHMMEKSEDGRANKAIRRVIRGFSERQDLKRFPGLLAGITKHITYPIKGKHETIVFKKKFVVFNDDGKILSFYPNWTENGDLDRNGKGNLRHILGEAIFHKIDLGEFFPPTIIDYTDQCKSGTEFAAVNIEMDHIRSVIIHLNTNNIIYE